jgi:hypothetical protein
MRAIFDCGVISFVFHQKSHELSRKEDEDKKAEEDDEDKENQEDESSDDE